MVETLSKDLMIRCAANKDSAAVKLRSYPGKTKNLGGQNSMKRPGQPAELASVYVQLAASDASYATGQVYGSSRRKWPTITR